MAAGRSAFWQLMANNTLRLGFSATAMHYVSVKPLEIPNHLHSACGDAPGKAAFAAQAAKLGENLLARAMELIPGGRFICLNFGIDEAGRYLGNTGSKHMLNIFINFVEHFAGAVPLPPVNMNARPLPNITARLMVACPLTIQTVRFVRLG